MGRVATARLPLPMPRAMLMLCVLWLLAGTGCSSPAPVVNLPAPTPPPVAAVEYSAAATILSGFEIAPSREEWSIGDQVLVAIRATGKTGVTTRFLLVELTGTVDAEPMTFKTSDPARGAFRFESPVARTRLALFDETGARIDQATGRFAVKFLGAGVFDGASPYTDLIIQAGTAGPKPAPTSPRDLPAMSDEQFERAMRGWLTLMAFSGSMNKRGMFKEMMQDVIARPNLLKLIFNPSVALTFPKGQVPARRQRWTPGHPEVPITDISAWVSDAFSASRPDAIAAVELPLQLSIAGDPAMIGLIHCVEPLAPLSLCGGLVYAKGWNPEHPEIALEITLLASRRGTGGQVFTEPMK